MGAGSGTKLDCSIPTVPAGSAIALTVIAGVNCLSVVSPIMLICAHILLVLILSLLATTVELFKLQNFGRTIQPLLQKQTGNLSAQTAHLLA